MRVVDSVEIDRPASLVWAYVADYGNDTSWRAAVTQMRPSVPGPAQVGVCASASAGTVGAGRTGWSRFQARPLPSGQR